MRRGEKANERQHRLSAPLNPHAAHDYHTHRRDVMAYDLRRQLHVNSLVVIAAPNTHKTSCKSKLPAASTITRFFEFLELDLYRYLILCIQSPAEIMSGKKNHQITGKRVKVTVFINCTRQHSYVWKGLGKWSWIHLETNIPGCRGSMQCYVLTYTWHRPLFIRENSRLKKKSRRKTAQFIRSIKSRRTSRLK